MAGYVNDFEFHINEPDLSARIMSENKHRRVLKLQLDGDELEAALWGLDNFDKITKAQRQSA